VSAIIVFRKWKLCGSQHVWKLPALAYIGVEAMAGTDSGARGCFKICRGGSVKVVGPSTVLVFVLGIVELWLLLRFDSKSSSYISFSSAKTCFPLLNFLSFSNSGLQCSTNCFRSASLNPNSRRLFSAANFSNFIRHIAQRMNVRIT